ncbi:SubName: Full=Uncharacterized protein {ECO:0000313/EMBL:CCA73158.1} [Serendipita indica DSM 11827]|nr:SubName: Full=Uncharacterized protein {ECO:0000313/EMBL:CCA73158.1} [Serendipita indica DSM 11827]
MQSNHLRSSRAVHDISTPCTGIAIGNIRWRVETPDGDHDSPIPSVESEANHRIGRTVPKHAFFAGVRSPLSSPVDGNLPSVSGSPPKAGLFNSIVPMLKVSSLGSLLGLGKPSSSSSSSNSLGVPNHSKSIEPRDALKATISKPHLEELLSPLRGESQLEASLHPGPVARQTSDDGGVDFQAGTAIVYPKETRKIETTSQATCPIKDPLPDTAVPLFILGSPALSQEIPALLRKRLNESEAAGYVNEDFGTSSQSTINGGGDDVADGFEISSTDPLELLPGQLLRKAVYISKSVQSGSVVLATVTLAVRSPDVAGVKLVPSPKPIQKSPLGDFVPPSSPLTELAFSDESPRKNPGSKSRLVEFANEVQYDAGSSSDGGYHYRSYEGSREYSQKAVVGGLYGTPPSSWIRSINPVIQSRIAVISPAANTRLVDRVLYLREPPRHNRAIHQVSMEPTAISRMPSQHPPDLPSSDGSFRGPRNQVIPEYTLSLASDGESPTSGYHPSPMPPPVNTQLTEKLLSVTNGEGSENSQPAAILREPPQIPLPALPPHSSNYFDVSESSSASSSDSAILRHTGGMDRILVCARGHFTSLPLSDSGSYLFFSE